MTDMRNMDEALRLWARDDRVDPAAVERLVQHAEGLAGPARPRRWLPWAAGGGALAASVAVALMIAAPREAPPQEPAAPMTAALPDADFSGQASFALLYTPTADEEQYI
jgi:hypothetical protein